MIEELADIKQELYVALTIDRGHRGPALLVSTKGGMDIEEVAANNPEDIHTEPIDPLSGLMPFQTRRLVRRLGLDQAVASEAANRSALLRRLFSFGSGVSRDRGPRGRRSRPHERARSRRSLQRVPGRLALAW